MVFSDALRWGSATLCALGGAGALYGALAALGDRDGTGSAAFGLVSLSGLALSGLASSTPKAMLGAVFGMVVSGYATAAAIAAFGALQQRTGTVPLRDIRGLGTEAPLLAVSLGLCALGTAALPGSASFWMTSLVVTGLVGHQLVLTALLLVAAVLLAISQARPIVRSVRGRLPDRLRRGEALTPYGGHLPELRPRELLSLAPLLVLIIALGLYPAPLLRRAQTAVRDISDFIAPQGDLTP
jgi:NADH-quinone oxidoreductase subunit M